MGQVLSALRYNVEGLEAALQGQPPGGFVDRLLPRAREASALVSQAASSLQRVVAELRPAALDVLGICPALLELGRRFGALSEARCSVVVPDRVDGFGTDVDTALFRVGQEALTNVARHSGAKKVTLSLEVEDGEVVLGVEDDGRGLPPDGQASTSFGLSSMRERVERLGGTLRLGRGAAGGTSVEARIPVVTPGRPRG
jgi:two-component system sensor histidine kinase UhpB